MLFKWSSLLILCFSISTLYADELCETINDISNEWNDVANFVDECGNDEVFTDEEIETLVAYITGLAEDTYFLADALIDLGNDWETRLGTSMRKTMARLAETDDVDATVELLDQLVDIIDQTTDYCDE